MIATVWAYPRDLLEDGVARAADCVAGLGLDGIRLASACHGGRLLFPRGSGSHGLAIQPVLSNLLEGAGIEHIAFHDYGVLPRARLGWLTEAAQAFRS